MDQIVSWLLAHFLWVALFVWIIIGFGVSSFHLDWLTKDLSEASRTDNSGAQLFLWLCCVIVWPSVAIYWTLHHLASNRKRRSIQRN